MSDSDAFDRALGAALAVDWGALSERFAAAAQVAKRGSANRQFLDLAVAARQCTAIATQIGRAEVALRSLSRLDR